jgi:hypothetical protein
MIELMLAGLVRLPPRIRRFLIAVGALLALGAVIAALTPTTPHGSHQRRVASQPRAVARLSRNSLRRIPPPVSAGELALAHQVAQRFLAGYLGFAHGSGSALAISGVTPSLRRQLLRRRAQVTLVARRRWPRVVSVQTIGTMPTFVVATAVIDDGGVAMYPVRFTLNYSAGRWAVSSVEVR